MEVEAVLSAPEEQLDYAGAKLRLDALMAPALDIEAVSAELDEWTDKARLLAGREAGEAATLSALRKLIYEAGAWNDHRPFAYDHDRYRDLDVKLLPTYLSTRRGNCVSMPILFLILADRLGLDMSLATAPLHLWVSVWSFIGLLASVSGFSFRRETWFPFLDVD